ncbi:MAG: hypothetical protein KVP17_000987 [Porospora cf. gigantea B]|uniref:uncharacterized protein n=2 Tax=Porospora cf. gigantea B TaxID=2853592 RepID=UPI00357183FE|nr:MAG: hypothetical protein KVP17_000987 [Porospora cf. gigantea B]
MGAVMPPFTSNVPIYPFDFQQIWQESMPVPILLAQDVPAVGEADYEAREKQALGAAEINLNMQKRKTDLLRSELRRLRLQKQQLEEEAVRRAEEVQKTRERDTMVDQLDRLAKGDRKPKR